MYASTGVDEEQTAPGSWTRVPPALPSTGGLPVWPQVRPGPEQACGSRVRRHLFVFLSLPPGPLDKGPGRRAVLPGRNEPPGVLCRPGVSRRVSLLLAFPARSADSPGSGQSLREIVTFAGGDRTYIQQKVSSREDVVVALLSIEARKCDCQCMCRGKLWRPQSAQ